MSTESWKNNALKRVRTIADYQFGVSVGETLFPQECEYTRSKTGRIRQVSLNGVRLATVRAQDGWLTLSMLGAQRLHAALPFPCFRVVIQDDVADFIKRGKSAFAKHVIQADPAIRSGDEVIVVTCSDILLATGTAVLSGGEMLKFNYGVAVKVRQGNDLACYQEK